MGIKSEVVRVREVGIVLNHKGRNITVFERTQHRLDGITYIKNVPRGAFVSYNIVHEKGEAILQDVMLEYMPLVQARSDIYFLHSLIEICYNFIPEGGCEFIIYPTIVKIFKSFELVLSENLKKVLLCRLFAHLGIYPINSELYEPLEEFLKMPIDNLIAGNLELANEDFFDRWLLWCLENHPQGKKCKALPLLLQK